METRPRPTTQTASKTPSTEGLRWPVSERCELYHSSWGHDLAPPAIIQNGVMNMPPTLEARTADRAIACLRKAIEELAAERPREARAMVVNATGSVAALREMIEGQVLYRHGLPPHPQECV